MSQLPAVSVVIPSYNGAHKLPNLLAALTHQTFKDFEVIVVIDGSTDGSERICNRIEQHKLTL